MIIYILQYWKLIFHPYKCHFVSILGRDLIGVQNLMKKHQALQAEVAGHEPRINNVCQSGQDMINGGHFAGDQIDGKIKDLKDKWQALKVMASFILTYYLPVMSSGVLGRNKSCTPILFFTYFIYGRHVCFTDFTFHRYSS